ncbi:MAG: hypothetical protein ABI251_08370 [Mycobacteriaceae bacterium]
MHAPSMPPAPNTTGGYSPGGVEVRRAQFQPGIAFRAGPGTGGGEVAAAVGAALGHDPPPEVDAVATLRWVR